MKKTLTVGELRKALEGVPDNLEVRLSSDSGLDQEPTIIEKAWRVSYRDEDYFSIYANVLADDDDDYWGN